jgi:hypothetical protein
MRGARRHRMNPRSRVVHRHRPIAALPRQNRNASGGHWLDRDCLGAKKLPPRKHPARPARTADGVCCSSVLQAALWQHFLNFLADPQGHGSLRSITAGAACRPSAPLRFASVPSPPVGGDSGDTGTFNQRAGTSSRPSVTQESPWTLLRPWLRGV